MSCVLCEPPSGQVLFENDDAFVLLHEDWAVRGHVMVVARRHVENVSDLAADEWLRVAAVWHRAEQTLLAMTGADRSIVVKLGVQTPHLHLHLYPVTAAATRGEILAAINAETRQPYDESFVAELVLRFESTARSRHQGT